ncbi:hypothetical protein FOMPIDRAFT_46431 [Fomitopsis schrenkii]|uniref:Uncharacterized protein n=1 Tax=Fomitopsis schrenkii TaxID=2126942 RepID=S8E992_FOMSC|nr:hypothetical protein FOMPIDRAFT_46431 [Fomitopsis schrenkii]
MSSTAYINVHTLKDGHTDTINALTFSPDGSQLASGSDDRSVVVWSVTKGTLLHRLFFDSCVDCVLWHPLQEDTLVVACEDGSLRQVHGFSLVRSHLQYSINFGVVSTIYALDYHMKTGHLGAAIGTEVHVTKEITPNKYSPVTTLLPHPAEDFDPEDARHHAVTVQFDQSGKHLIVSYLHHGIVSWDIETCQCVWRINPPEGYPALGCCAVSPNDRDIVVHNFRDGLLSYHINAFNQARARRTHQFDRTPKSNVALQVGFLHSGSAVFCGTSTGNVCIWQKRTGEFFQQLPHDGDIVPAVASTRRGDRSYIATGCAFKGGDTYIKIWRARIRE